MTISSTVHCQPFRRPETQNKAIRKVSVPNHQLKQEKMPPPRALLITTKHRLGKCHDFLQTFVQERINSVRSSHFCFNSLSPVTRKKTANRLFDVKSSTAENDITLAFIAQIRDQRPLPPNLVILTTNTLKHKAASQLQTVPIRKVLWTATPYWIPVVLHLID